MDVRSHILICWNPCTARRSTLSFKAFESVPRKGEVLALVRQRQESDISKPNSLSFGLQRNVTIR